MLDLIMWALDVDFHETDELTLHETTLEYSSYFIPIFSEFVNDSFNNYLLDVLDTQIEELSSSSSMEIKHSIEEFNNKEIPTEEDIQMYHENIERLSLFIKNITKLFLDNVKYLPQFVGTVFKSIYNLMKEENCTEETTMNVLNELFVEYIVCHHFNEPFEMLYDDSNKIRINKAFSQIVFISDLLYGLYSNNSIYTNLIDDTKKCLNEDPNNTIIKQVIKAILNMESSEPEKEGENKEKDQAMMDLLEIIQLNIQEILELIPGPLGVQLTNIMKMYHNVYDDYQIYHFTMNSFGGYIRGYNIQSLKLLSENVSLMNEYKKVFFEQEELLKELDDLERKSGQGYLDKIGYEYDNDFLFKSEHMKVSEHVTTPESAGQITPETSLASSTGAKKVNIFSKFVSFYIHKGNVH